MLTQAERLATVTDTLTHVLLLTDSVVTQMGEDTSPANIVINLSTKALSDIIGMSLPDVPEALQLKVLEEAKNRALRFKVLAGIVNEIAGVANANAN